MDETLLHAATLEDIFEHKLYGENAIPNFTTDFHDQDVQVHIGVFLRPFLKEML